MADSDFKWYKHRRYLHFDQPIGFAKANRLVSDCEAVATHSFYPLIRYPVISKRIRSNQNTGKIESRIKKRPISYAAHCDSHIYSYYAHKLAALYEKQLDSQDIGKCVLAFRSLKKSNIQFAKMAFNEIKRQGNCVVIALDVSKFFDSLDHSYLKDAWASLLQEDRLPPDHFSVFKSVTKWSVVDKVKLYETLGISLHNPKKGNRHRLCDAPEFRTCIRGQGLIKTNLYLFGIPQGTSISALLSNIYMLKFDKAIFHEVNKIGGVYYRYCDDMMIVLPTNEKDRILEFVTKNIKDLKLEINSDKTNIRYFRQLSTGQVCDRPLQYLGFTFDGQRILIRSAGLARYSQKMKKGVRFAKATMRKRNNARTEKGLSAKPLYKKELYRRYSHVGRRNFLRYGYRAADIMKSQAIKRQLKPLWKRLNDEIEK